MSNKARRTFNRNSAQKVILQLAAHFPSLKLKLFVPLSKTKEHARYFNPKSDFVLLPRKNEKPLS